MFGRGQKRVKNFLVFFCKMNPNSARTLKPKMIFNYESSISYDQQEAVYHLIKELLNPKTKQNAILELSKIRDDVPDMGPLLWYTFGALAVLLQEILTIYPKLSPPRLSNAESNSACSALALLQCTAAHPETRQLFLNANIHRFIYPFLDTVPHTKPLEYLKLTSLGVIGALVKNDEEDVINFLLSSEIIPSCLRNMEYGSDLSKTVATYIMQRILSFECGLNYICQTYERFSHVADVLNKMVYYLLQEPSSNLLKLVIRCYLHLSENPRAREALRQSLPDPLKDDMFMKYLKDDRARLWLDQLHENLRNL